MEILPFSPAHYAAFTALWNEAYPDLSRTELELRLADLSRGCAPARWVTEHEGQVVAMAGYEHPEDEEFHPRKYQLHLIVSSAYRQRGIGGALYQRVLNELSLINALIVRAWVRADRSDSRRFLSTRGFAEKMRTFHSSLDVASFDLSRLTRYEQRLEKRGYQFMAFPDLVKDPERNRKAYELYCEVLRDIPAAEAPRLPTLADYERIIATAPDAFRAYFIAVHNDNYVGLCRLLPKDRNRRELYADTLGIKRAYRGRGIAQALSGRGIEYAKSRGYALISADNFSANEQIIPLLESLGFANRSIWTLFSKSLADNQRASVENADSSQV